jgi:hypothetical protein
LAAGVSPETMRAGISIPLRAIAVFNSARRFSEVAVDIRGLDEIRESVKSQLNLEFLW